MRNFSALKTALFFLVCHAALGSQPQQDSSSLARKDSMLAIQQKQSKALLQTADSLHLADSLEQENILSQIEALQASDERKKQELKQRLDSLALIQTKRQERIKWEVDSLRAATPGVPVILFKDSLFYIYSKLGPFSPSERAANIAKKVEMLVNEGLFKAEQIQVHPSEESYDVLHEEIILFSITDRDAFWLNKSPQEVAELYAQAIKSSVERYKESTGLFAVLKRVALLLLVLALFFFGIKYLNKGFTRLNLWLLKRGKKYIRGVSFKNYEFLAAEREEQVVRWLLQTVKWLSIALVVYLVLPVVFSIFPATKGIASALFGYVLYPLKKFALGILGYIPELITIIVIILITRYFVRFLKFLSEEVATGKLNLPGFYPDWAGPTFNLLKIIIYAFAFVIIFPYLPGSDSPVFQGVSVFFGLLISLGSSSAIGNIIAGLVITYMRAFRIGDRVKIGETSGDVVEKTMLVTRLRTIKNEDVTIPNSAILNGSTINYSSSAQSLGLILNSTVTIGYDVPWRKVHEQLIKAALNTEHIQAKPQPFVLQTSLDDFYVSYQVNAYTQEAASAAKIYSQLHANIQDAFNEAGIEILSPHYRAARDGNMVTIPAEYLPKDYKAPSFRVQTDKQE
ncbi:MAG: mechanosensitive ion channel family protein [Luteibaculum sp.]